MKETERSENHGVQCVKLHSPWWLAVIGMVFLFVGCSTNYYRKSADKEAYNLIKTRGPRVPNMETNFTIETNAIVSLEDLPVVEKADEALGPDGKMEIGCRTIPLDRALKVAVKNSRDYQSRKEDLYVSALSLSLTRHQYTPIFSGGARSFYTRAVRDGVDGLVETHEYDVGGNGSASMLLSSGAQLVTSFTVGFQRFFLGDSGSSPRSSLSATLTQPLLRGRGYQVTMENLTQAERQLLYDLRDFARYRKEFAVSIASTYYNVLQNRDSVRNLWMSFQASKKTADRTRAFYREGQRKKSDLARFEQDELDYETRWVRAIRTYRQSLDRFKTDLGLSTEARVVLDERDLSKLQIQHPSITSEDAIRVAMVSRLDFYNTRDKFEDSARKIKVAANNLKPQLDLVLQANVPQAPGSGIPELSLDRTTVSGGMQINDNDISQKSERNAYRSRLIDYDRARRQLEIAVDNIKLQVLDSWRGLDEAKRNFESSEIGVKLAERRVAEQNLLDELGRGNAEERVSSLNSLTSVRNSRTAALVSHTMSRIRLWQYMGILTINEDGRWEEVENVKQQ